MGRVTVVSATVAALSFVACGGQPAVVSHVGSQQVSIQNATVLPPAPPPSTTGGFDGSRAYAHVRHLVDLGPRPPGSDAIRQAQSYIIEQLKSYGCHVEEHDFHASTPIGDLPMKNIIAKFRVRARHRPPSPSFIMTPCVFQTSSARTTEARELAL